jgi:DNA polymerase-3 subunit chi
VERADFYVLEGSDARERLKFACRVVDKAFGAEQRVLVWLDDAAAVQQFDDLLWTFAQDSFIPHEAVGAESSWEDAPVLLSCGAAAPAGVDVLINLSGGVPPAAQSAARVIEIIDADPARRQAGRARFKQYRALGIEPGTHNIGGPGAALG